MSKGLTASVTVDAPWLTPGIWGQDPTPLGPTNAAVTGSATEAESVTTLAFDRSAVAGTGDLWLAGVDPTAPALAPVTILPGQTGTVTVTFTPDRRERHQGERRGVRGHVQRGVRHRR